MKNHQTVSKDAWLVARKEHLIKEKEFTRVRDQLSQERRSLPWVKIDKDYIFDSPKGKETLAELFEERNQLIVIHFMFDPTWDEGCSGCSFLADHYNGAVTHLNHRDVILVAISKAPLDKLEAFKKRMGWSFKWVSSQDNDFNRDHDVSFTPEEQEKNEVYYNYTTGEYFSSEGPGISVFYKDEKGAIFHTYSTYARGLDMFIGAYHLLDLTPKGRDEVGLPYGMAWVRHHDKYDD